jgi:hypothetical protein
MLLSGFGAGFALFKAFPPGEESKVAWAAVAAAGIVSGLTGMTCPALQPQREASKQRRRVEK